ncbi:maleylpyruvate isomerase family mycothiol-dependent enzyme [Allonocardiopsis opalescens]|uniref:Uncharacterized protein (TIGR03083 family) n=1 Tax=Allonocardiopsis opalescens TaxID=1144618 RepID=A0A2T0PUA8_9ACTN|nr:maleylpyruvate isomerase family mycothiol-dependent enzyme [Allonocardiopsis opalescens]PRX92489.1 uncharacterized protein (TIGR03083 family) [Allonocardiopsis opalescens]
MAAAATTMPNRARLRAMALAERARVRDTLAGLAPGEWSTPTLCAGWTVRELAGHLAANVRDGLGGLLAGMARTGFDHDAHNRRRAAAWAARPVGELLAALDTDRLMPVFRLAPGLLLYDTLVHHQDLRRPLGRAAEIPEAHLRAVLGRLTSGRAGARLRGLRLAATDLDWAFGEGSSQVSGPAEALMMALAGRPAARAELSGGDALPGG